MPIIVLYAIIWKEELCFRNSDGGSGRSECAFNLPNNSNTLSGSSEGSALSVYTPEILDAAPHKVPNLYIIHTHFTGNRLLSGRPITTVYYITRMNIYKR